MSVDEALVLWALYCVGEAHFSLHCRSYFQKEGDQVAFIIFSIVIWNVVYSSDTDRNSWRSEDRPHQGGFEQPSNRLARCQSINVTPVTAVSNIHGKNAFSYFLFESFRAAELLLRKRNTLQGRQLATLFWEGTLFKLNYWHLGGNCSQVGWVIWNHQDCCSRRLMALQQGINQDDQSKAGDLGRQEGRKNNNKQLL